MTFCIQAMAGKSSESPAPPVPPPLHIVTTPYFAHDAVLRGADDPSFSPGTAPPIHGQGGPVCGSCPAEIRFANDSGDVGALSTRLHITLQMFKSIGFHKPQVSQGEPDPFAQHDDGEPT